ncbi:nuclear transport factor 2 family protein [Candidatus Peregrinibacteria bacterium]|nr:MAG: nuclear transport factor 2 family protein [Candidatus Peregrinibacteria bacterium]
MNDEIQKVKELEIELLQPNTRRSVKRLNELLADDFFEFMQSGGSTNKKEIIAYLPNAPEEQFIVREMEAKVLSKDNILLHYIADRKVLESGEEKCTLCSSVWQMREGKWQMIFFQGTPAKK